MPQASFDRGALPLLMAVLVFVASAISWLMPDALSALVVATLAAALAGFLAWRRIPPEVFQDDLADEEADDDQPYAAPDPLADALKQAQQREAELSAQYAAHLSTLRHDVRGALSPALLIADRLMMANDADKKKAGDTISRAIIRANELLRKPDPESTLTDRPSTPANAV